MKILSAIKSHKVATLVVTGALVLTGGGIAYASTRPSEKTETVQSSALTPVEKTEQLPVNKTETEIDQTEVTPTVAPQPVQESQEVPEPKQLTRNEVLVMAIQERDAYVFTNQSLQKRAVHSAVTLNYDRDPSLFTEANAKENILKCYAFLDTVAPEVINLNLSKGDCGL